MMISVVSFSGRRGGNCDRIADVICRHYKGEQLSLFRFSEKEISACGRCEYECFNALKACPYVSDGLFSLYTDIIASDLAYYLVPNYCDFPCANFFAFNERSQCFFQGHGELVDKYLSVRKRFVVVSNTGKQNFVQAFCDHVAPGDQPDVLFMSASHFHKSSIAGDLMESEDAKNELSDFLLRK